MNPTVKKSHQLSMETGLRANLPEATLTVLGQSSSSLRGGRIMQTAGCPSGHLSSANGTSPKGQSRHNRVPAHRRKSHTIRSLRRRSLCKKIVEGGKPAKLKTAERVQ